MNSSSVLCPYCGVEINNLWVLHFDEDKWEEIKCPRCSKTIEIMLVTIPAFRVQKKVEKNEG